MTNRAKAISYENRARLFLIFASIAVLSLFAYVYAINATARNIALRQGLERQIADISANLNSLEFAYIELRNNVTIELAYHYGFQEIRNPLYISRTRPASLSFNTLEQ